MEFFVWLQVLLVCVLGAMSPGPSLAIVMRNTVRGGRSQGVLTGIGHGIGIFFYACLVVTGLGIALSTVPQLERIIGIAGVALLLWLSFNFLGIKFGSATSTQKPSKEIVGHSGFVTGFLIAFLNPKIAAFFLAIFAPFLSVETTTNGKIIMAVTAGVIDTLWYVIVALTISGSVFNSFFEKNADNIDRAIGLVLLCLAVWLIYRM